MYNELGLEYYAVLHLIDPLPRGIHALAMTGSLQLHERWRSIGFPADVPDVAGFALVGTVTNTDGRMTDGAPVLQLYCQEAATRIPLAGVSGSPVLVGASDVVAGIIRWNPPSRTEPGLGVGASLFACRMSDVLQEVPDLRSIAGAAVRSYPTSPHSPEEIRLLRDLPLASDGLPSSFVITVGNVQNQRVKINASRKNIRLSIGVGGALVAIVLALIGEQYFRTAQHDRALSDYRQQVLAACEQMEIGSDRNTVIGANENGIIYSRSLALQKDNQLFDQVAHELGYLKSLKAPPDLESAKSAVILAGNKYLASRPAYIKEINAELKSTFTQADYDRFEELPETRKFAALAAELGDALTALAGKKCL